MERFRRDYSKLSKEELIKKLDDLESTIDPSFDFPWARNLGEWQWDLVADKVTFNKKKATALGYNDSEIPEEVGFEFFTKKLHPDDYEMVMQNMRDHLSGKTDAYDVEYRIQTKEGHYKWYFDRGVIIRRDAANKPLLLVGIVFDISKNKKMEEDNVLLAKLTYANPDIILLFNLDHEVIYINPAGKKTLNNNIEEVLPNDFYEMLESSYKNNEILSINFASNETEYRLKIRPFPNEKQCMVSLSDITELVKVKNQKNLYYDALNAINQAMFITDRAGIIVHVNKEFLDLYGYSEDEVIGQNPSMLSSGKRTYLNLGYSESDYHKLYKSMWASIMDNNGKWKGVVINRSKTGRIIWTNLFINAIIDDNNEVSHFICLPIDITNMIENTMTSKSELYQSIANLGELRDNETGSHMRRVGLYSKLIAKHLGLPDKFCDDIENFAPMHDLGKVGIPDNILLAPRKLTFDEFETMKKHTIYGHNIVKKNKDMSLVSDITLSHHEKYDGSGYPYGLKGTEIPISARIVALADVYDALRSKRPYKKGWEEDKVLAYIKDNRGLHFDPMIVDLFLTLREQFDRIYNELLD